MSHKSLAIIVEPTTDDDLDCLRDLFAVTVITARGTPMRQHRSTWTF